jgi:hypothetical protein
MATTFSVLAVLGSLILFCLFFTMFLLVPFFIFIAGGIALVITERRSKTRSEAPRALPPEKSVGALPEKSGGARR